jgi:hypothetical protein
VVAKVKIYFPAGNETPVVSLLYWLNDAAPEHLYEKRDMMCLYLAWYFCFLGLRVGGALLFPLSCNCENILAKV